MPLSDHEQRILEEIERRLAEDDPAFVEQVGRTDLYTHLARRIRLASIAFCVGLVMIMLFVWSVVVAAIGFVVTVLSAVLLYRYVGQLGRDQLRMMQDEGFTLSGLLGRIAAGAPLEVVDYEERIPVPRFLLGRVKPDRVYALRVKGDSMIDEHICDGDIALIENRTDARDGEIVVALLIEENQATLKRLYRRGVNIELQPANSQLQPLTVPASQVRVQGIFRGLLRPSN